MGGGPMSRVAQIYASPSHQRRTSPSPAILPIP